MILHGATLMFFLFCFVYRFVSLLPLPPQGIKTVSVGLICVSRDILGSKYMGNSQCQASGILFHNVSQKVLLKDERLCNHTEA